MIDKATEDMAMAVIYGEPGSGKSETCKRKSENSGGIYIECDAYLTTRGLFKRITSALGIDGKRSLSETLEVIVDALKHRDVVLYIDEAEYLQYKSLEMLRRIWDFSGTTIIFIGIEDIIKNLKKHGQLFSRIKWKWQIDPLGIRDVESLCKSMDINTDESTIKTMLNYTRGNFRSTFYLLDNAKDLSGNEVDAMSIKRAKDMLLI